MTSYSLALFLHVIVVVYLLGADLGRLYLARIGADGATPPDSRLLAARAVGWLGSVTNLSLIMILPAGVSVGVALGAYQLSHPAWLVATWIVALLWAALSFGADRAASGSAGRLLSISDVILRLVLGPGFIYDATLVFAGTARTVDADWLGAKIGLYSLLILASIPIRMAGFRIRRRLAVVGPDTAHELSAALKSLQNPTVFAWIVIIAAAWLGVAKPL